MSNTSNLDHGTLEDADLDAVSGGFASNGGVWLACYITAQRFMMKEEDAQAPSFANPQP